MQLPPEQLGPFYLGANFDLQSGSHTSIPIKYDIRALTTYAVCIGMKGNVQTWKSR